MSLIAERVWWCLLRLNSCTNEILFLCFTFSNINSLVVSGFLLQFRKKTYKLFLVQFFLCISWLVVISVEGSVLACGSFWSIRYSAGFFAALIFIKHSSWRILCLVLVLFILYVIMWLQIATTAEYHSVDSKKICILI